MSSGGLFVSRTISISTVFRGSSVGSVGRIPSMSLRILETRRRWRITSSRHREAVTVMAGVSVIRAGSSDRPETTGHPIRVAPQVWPDHRQPGHEYSTASHLCTERQSGPDSMPQNRQKNRRGRMPGNAKKHPSRHRQGGSDGARAGLTRLIKAYQLLLWAATLTALSDTSRNCQKRTSTFEL